MFLDTIPEFESGEFLKFEDEAKEPKRYIVKINKMKDTSKNVETADGQK